MAQQNDPNALAKAHSLATHLGKMVKAVHSFHEHMVKLHKAHQDDMHAALGKLHKMVGIEPAEEAEYGATGGEPQATNLTGEGTHNLQDFGGDAEKIAKAAVAKYIAEQNLTKKAAEEAAKKAAEGGNLTKAEVQEMLTAAMQDFAGTFVKALAGDDDNVLAKGKGKFCPDCGSPTEKCACAKTTKTEETNGLVKATGIGDRSQVQQPVQQVVTDRKSVV